MSAFASPATQLANLAIFPRDSRYHYRTTRDDEAKVIAFPSAQVASRATMAGWLKAIGQYSIENCTYGVFTIPQFDEAMRTYGQLSRRSCYAWRKRMIAAGVLAQEGRLFRLVDFHLANRSYEQMQALKEERRRRRNNGQNLRRRAARLAAAEAQPAPAGGGVKPHLGSSVPKVEKGSPEIAATGDISGGDATHLCLGLLTHPQTCLSPKPQAFTQRPSFQPRGPQKDQVPPPKSNGGRSKIRMSDMDSLASVLATVLPPNIMQFGGGSLISGFANDAPKPVQPTQPSPSGKGLGSDKSEFEERLGCSREKFRDKLRRVIGRQAEQESKAAKQASP